MPEELWMEVCVIVQKDRKKNCKKDKWLSEEALQITGKTSNVKGKGEKENIYPFECRIPKNSKER